MPGTPTRSRDNAGHAENALRQLLIQFNRLIGALFKASGSATYDAASLADAAGATTTVTATGAALGDFVLVAHSVALAGITVTAWVSAADTVSVRFQNESGGVVDLASGTLRVLVIDAAAATTAVQVADLAGTVISS